MVGRQEAMKNNEVWYFALGFLVLGWYLRRRQQQQLDPVMRLRVAGVL